MYKKTLNTLKSNPIILLGFAVPILLSVLAIIPMVSGISDFMQDIAEAEARGVGMSDAQVFSFMSRYFISFAMVMVVSLASMFLILPPVLNKTYEACSGIKEGGWYARGLKRSWWKMFVTTIIISALSSMLAVVIVLAVFIPFVGIFAYLAVILGISVVVVIAHTSVIAEDEFGTGLSNIFTVGFKYFFKQLGAFALVNIPTFLLGIAAGVVTWIKVVNMSYSYSSDAAVMEVFNSIMPIVWIFTGVIFLYSIFSTAFTYVFSMHSYLNKKAELAQFTSNQ